MNDEIKRKMKSNIYSNFLYTEIVKRHIEEYNKEIISNIEQIRDGLSTFWDNEASETKYIDDNIFSIVIGEALISYVFYKKIIALSNWRRVS